MKVLVLPRDPNPYQESVYGELGRNGVEVRYIGELTPSRTVNVALLPAELMIGRLCGYRVLHIHWVYLFALPWLSRRAGGRRVMRWWFGMFLSVACRAGLRVVWIAHNVLPHEQVFDDDVAGRRALLSAADAVVVHSAAVLDELAGLGPLPTCRQVARFPGYNIADSLVASDADEPLHVLFFGSVSGYKGVPDLLRASDLVEVPLQVTIAGLCRDAALRHEIETLASAARHPVQLRLTHLSETELDAALRSADLVVLPFTRVTTSSSLLHALSAGRTVVLPDTPSLADIPDDAVVRYARLPDPVRSLGATLARLAGDRQDVVARGRAGRHWSRSYSWSDLATEIAVASGANGPTR